MTHVKKPSVCPLCESQETVFYFADSKNAQHVYDLCRQCDLVFVLPEYRLRTAEEKARYDMHNNDNSQPYVDFLSRLATPMLSALDKPSKGLDFGSGKSQAMADLFRTAGHDCQCYDIYYYPQPELLKQRYDFIVASEVIEHLYHPKQVIEQWLSLLNTDGVLGIMTGIRGVNQDFESWWYKNDPTHVGLFSEKTFQYLAAAYGLALVFQKKNVVLYSKKYI